MQLRDLGHHRGTDNVNEGGIYVLNRKNFKKT